MEEKHEKAKKNLINYEENLSETRSDVQTNSSKIHRFSSRFQEISDGKTLNFVENEANLSLFSEDSCEKGDLAVLKGMWERILEFFPGI